MTVKVKYKAVSVSDEQHNTLEKIKEEIGIPRARIVSDALNEYLKKNFPNY